MKMSDTPRTDEREMAVDSCEDVWVVSANFARGLERELNAAQALIRQQQLLDEENQRLKERLKQMEDAIEMAWLILANVSGGDWEKQHPDWKEAVTEWRDNQFSPIWSEISARKAKEAA